MVSGNRGNFIESLYVKTLSPVVRVNVDPAWLFKTVSEYSYV